MKCKQVFIFPNGMVIAFDGNGEQMAGLQGQIFDSFPILRVFCDEDTKFWFALPEEGRLEALAWSWMFKEAEEK